MHLFTGAVPGLSGAVGSLYDIPWDMRLNHRLEVTSGVLAEDCGELLREFFQRKRPGEDTGAEGEHGDEG